MADFDLTSATKFSSINATDNFFVNQGGALGQAPIQKILDKAAINSLETAKAGIEPNMLDGIFIMYHSKSDSFPRLCEVSGWKSLENAGDIADGVAVFQGDKHLVISPTEAYLHWSSAAIQVGSVTSDRITAINDWSGKSRTAAIMLDATLKSDGAAYAPGWCNAYSRANTKGKGLTAGNWWLPSAGELIFIKANFRKINMALSVISGATLLNGSWYWSSTESDPAGAWGLGFGDGLLNGWKDKVGATGYVRAVSAFGLGNY